MAKRSAWEDRKDFYFDRRAAYNAIRFFENEIYHVKGPKAGQKLVLERWQRRFLRRLYGWKRRDDRTRRYRVAFMFVPRKNGKSLLGAGCALYGLFGDGELGAEVVSAAVDKNQARVIFDVAAQIVQMNPRLSAKCTVYKGSIIVHSTASKYTVLSADVENKHGSNPSTIVFDELHTQPDGRLVEVLKTGIGARAQPLQVYFTTAGYDKNSVCYEYYERAKQALSGETYDPTFLGVIYEATADDIKEGGWKREEVWRKANPCFGVSINPVSFMENFNDALRNRREENSFKRLSLNIWTEIEEVWLDMDQWDLCGVEKFGPEAFEGKICVGGIDISRKIDITAFVLIHMNDDGVVYSEPHFWIPKDGPWRKNDRVRDQYLAWIDSGFFKTTPGPVIDLGFVAKDIEEICKGRKVKELAYDPWRAEELATKLDSKGFKMVEIHQSFSRMSEPSKLLEALLVSSDLRHGGNPILTWMARHAAVDENAQGDIMPSKVESKSRIDGITALVLALSRVIVIKPKKKSRYETEGLDSA